MKPVFKSGDIVVMFGNTNDDCNDVGYCDDDMNEMIHGVYTIDRSLENDDGWMYKLREDPHDYWFDEEWLGLADAIESESKDIEDFFDEYK